jgi:SAM-dependent methyltransferase
LKERDIRPETLLRQYLELTTRDAHKCFGGDPRVAISCVACGAVEAPFQFEKNGFAYVRCAACGTLFLSPRPSIAAFEAFYRDSESARYWAEVFLPAVAEARRERMFRPRVDRVASMCRQAGVLVERLIDVGAGNGIFLDEWRARFPHTDLLAIEPSVPLARTCRSKGIPAIEAIAEDMPGRAEPADLVTCFEVLEHVHSPLDFLRALTGLARIGGYVCVTTLCIDGFDLQLLWEKSTQISPPHHINFPSVSGFERMFARAGLVNIRVATPGELDVDIVRNAAERDPEILVGQRFLQALLARTDASEGFQEFLSAHLLSSHAWIMAQRAEA